MDETSRKSSNVAVEQMIGNMTSDLKNADGQYIQLGFTPPQSPADIHWGASRITQNPFVPHYHHQNLGQESQMPFSNVEQIPVFPQQQTVPPFNYVQNRLFSSPDYDKHMNNCIDSHETYLPFQQGLNVQDVNIRSYQPNYRLFMSSDLQNRHVNDHCFIQNHQENLIQQQQQQQQQQTANNHTQLIDNLVGNWVPNTSGTYSPFGNVQPSKHVNFFKLQSESEQNSPQKPNPSPMQEIRLENTEKVPNIEVNNTIQFNRDVKKPTAEVKPMRPSYSDVLAKSVPPANAPKVGKVDVNNKDLKQKSQNSGSKKNGKNERTKDPKSGNALLNRSNPSSVDAKENANDKSFSSIKGNEKMCRDMKTNQLNRKWASLDNMNEAYSHDCENANNLHQDLTSSGRKSAGTKKFEDVSMNNNNNNNKLNAAKNAAQRKAGKNYSEWDETDSTNSKTEDRNVIKMTIKKGKDKMNASRQRLSDGFSCNERPPGKRGQRARKRDSHMPLGIVGQTLKHYLGRWWKLALCIIMWLLHLVYDIFSLSAHLSKELCSNSWQWLQVHWNGFLESSAMLLNQIQWVKWVWQKIKGKEAKEDPAAHSFLHGAGLQHNIPMPGTGEDAMKRLLACKGKDPYSILGVTPICTDDDIKRYYKRQAFLVHPDKNQQPGAEEAFKILVHAFDMIGEPERRAAYDRGVAESAQVEQAWSELTELLAQLQQKVEAAANTIRCSACGARHKRIKIDRPIYAARHCSQCRIHHAAREGDIWAEAHCMGFLWHYYACMEGGVYDITEWAGCQRDSLKHLRPNAHHVQYRIALGRQMGGGGTNGGGGRRNSNNVRQESPPDLEHLLSSLYGQPEGGMSGSGAGAPGGGASGAGHSRRRNNKRSNK